MPYYIFSIIFRGDAYGYLNAILMKLGILNAPILWLTTPDYIMPVIIIVTLWMSMSTGFLSFVAGLQGVDRSQYEAGYVDGIRNRWQELYYITLPNMKPMLMFGAVMSITSAFGVCDVPMALAASPPPITPRTPSSPTCSTMASPALKWAMPPPSPPCCSW